MKNKNKINPIKYLKESILNSETAENVSVAPGIKDSLFLGIKDGLFPVTKDFLFYNFCQKQTEDNDKNYKILKTVPIEINEYTDLRNFLRYIHEYDYRGEDLIEFCYSLAVKHIKEYNEKLIWLGNMIDLKYGNTDGLIKLLSNETSRNNISNQVQKLNKNNIIETVYEMADAIPKEIENPILFMSYDNFKMFNLALKLAQSPYNKYRPEDINYIPGTNVKITAIKVLDNTDYMIMTEPENIIIGTDLLNEEEKFDIYYDNYESSEVIKILIKYRIGVQIKDPGCVVTNF